MGDSKQGFPPWIGAAATRVDFEGKVSSMSSSSNPSDHHCGSSGAPPLSHSDVELSFGERALSAAGAAFVSAIIVNPLDVAKTRLQAQAAGFSYQSACRMGCETNTKAFTATQNGMLPGVLKTLLGIIKPVNGTSLLQNLHNYRFWWTGLGAQLARDVPFSAICWSTLEPIRRRLHGLAGDEASVATILGANFLAGFTAGTLAAAVTCPLDVAKTRRQIEKDPGRALKMTTRTTLLEIWRDGGLRGLFAGVGPRVGRTGPSVGIVVSFYEVVKYTLYHRHHHT